MIIYLQFKFHITPQNRTEEPYKLTKQHSNSHLSSQQNYHLKPKA